MYGKKLIFFIFFLFISGSLSAMELDPSEIRTEDSQEKIEIRLRDGILYVPEHLVREITFFDHCLAYAQVSDRQGEKENENSQSIDLSELKLYQGVHDDQQESEKVEKLDVSKNTLKKFFGCMKNKENIEKKLKPEIINVVFAVADSFGAPQALLRDLTLRARQILQAHEQPEKITQGHYLNSVRSLYNEGLLKGTFGLAFDNKGNMHGVLNFAEKNLDNVQGLEDYQKKYKKITIGKINLKGNQLTSLDIPHILDHFPSLKEINAKKNHITTVIFPDCFPVGFVLNLNNNCVQELPLFKVGEQAKIMLKKNVLNKKSRCLALAAAKLTFFQKNRHRYKALTDKNLLKNNIKGCALGAGGGLAILILLYPAFCYLANLVKESTPAGHLRWQQLSAGHLRLQRLLGNFIVETITDPTLTNYALYMYQNPTVFYTCCGLMIFFGIVFGGEYYYSHGYSQSLIHQFKPATIIFDEDDEPEKKDK